jgi:hypothetical protein
MGEERDKQAESRPRDADSDAEKPHDLEVSSEEDAEVTGGAARRLSDEGPEE